MRAYLIAITSILLLGLAGIAHASERITSFHSDLVVQRDGTLDVTETIAVQAEGISIRHGIYRDFPTRYRDTHGRAYVVGFTLLDAQLDGRSEPCHIEGRDNGMRVYLGSADITLPPGAYTYTLRYAATREIGFFADHDEVYWNVTGNGWSFPIDQASATVTLPAAIGTAQVKTAVYTGAYGSREMDATAEVDDQGHAHFATTRALAPKENLTIVVGFPTGMVVKPTGLLLLKLFFRDNPFFGYSLLIILIILGYYVVTWTLVGRDLPRGVVVPQWTPPEGLTPAAMRYIRREEFDTKVLTASVLSLAVKRYLAIREADDDTYQLKALVSREEAMRQHLLLFMVPRQQYTITALAGRVHGAPDMVRQCLRAMVDAGLPVALKTDMAMVTHALPRDPAHPAATLDELELYQSLFSVLDTFMLRDENYTTVQEITATMRQKLAAHYDGTLFCSNTGYFVTGVVLSIVFVTIAVCKLIVANHAAPGPYLAALVLTGLVVVITLMIRQSGFRGGLKGLFRAVVGILAVLSFSVFFVVYVGWHLVASSLRELASMPLILVPLLLLVGINGLFYHLMKASTYSGRRVKDAIEGFRLYLTVAEKMYLQRAGAPEKTPELFEQFLPYALVLDVEQQWAEQFHAVFAALRETGTDYQPDWYRGSHWHTFSTHPGGFAVALGDGIGNAIAASSTPPGSSSGFSSSSGVSGGGFSGGGGGGGGGGGW